MNESKWVTLVFCVAVDSHWAMGIWGGWVEKTYGNYGDIAWGMLRLFGIAASPENKILLLKSICAFGMILLTTGTVWYLLST